MPKFLNSEIAKQEQAQEEQEAAEQATRDAEAEKLYKRVAAVLMLIEAHIKELRMMLGIDDE